MSRPAKDDAKRRAQGFGRSAERFAALLLRLKGYRIVERRWRHPLGEIDLIVRRGGQLAFVEVKARPTLDEALAALGVDQRRRIERAAEAYRQAHPALAELAVRFDLVCVRPGRPPRHLPDAWRPGL